MNGISLVEQTRRNIFGEGKINNYVPITFKIIFEYIFIIVYLLKINVIFGRSANLYYFFMGLYLRRGP